MENSETLASVAVGITVVVNFAYFFFLQLLKSRTNLGLMQMFTWRKAGGFLVFGALPAAVVWIFFRQDPARLGLNLGSKASPWLWAAAASIILILLNVFNTRKQDIWSAYPEMRLITWGPGALALTVCGWLLYLTGYEFLFRGIFLQSCRDAFGLWPAVTFNIALYAALHLPKGMKEATAAIPFGALVCWLTVDSGSILPAVMVHSVQAISCDIFCILRNPGMQFTLTVPSET